MKITDTEPKLPEIKELVALYKRALSKRDELGAVAAKESLMKLATARGAITEAAILATIANVSE